MTGGVQTSGQPPVRPTVDDGRYVLEFGDVRFEADATLGGRITALCFEGHNILVGPEIDAVNFGSTFWTSPQEHWGWPPLVEIDSSPYEPSVDGDGDTIVMQGPTCPTLRVAIEKRFRAAAHRGALVLEYRIHNRSHAPLRLAPWQVTRVRPNGLTFFPAGVRHAPSNLPVLETGGVTWFSHAIDRVDGHQKLFADAREGWVAHVDGGVLLVKTFALVAREAQAPGEAQVEIYASTTHRYVEVELQGAYEIIPPGGVLTWNVDWWLRRLPDELACEEGNAALADFVRSMIAAGSG
jgi:Domain of unknown function (DUF4380)